MILFSNWLIKSKVFNLCVGIFTLLRIHLFIVSFIRIVFQDTDSSLNKP